MKNSMKILGPSETAWAVQCDVEEIDPQQLFARDLLVKKANVPFDQADEYVRRIGTSASANLKLLLQKSLDPADDFRSFEASLATVAH